MITEADVDLIMSQPDLARRVVAAAAKSLNAIYACDANGRTADGDDVLLPVRTELELAFRAEALDGLDAAVRGA